MPDFESACLYQHPKRKWYDLHVDLESSIFIWEHFAKKSEVFVHVMEVVQDFGTIFGIFFFENILWERELFKSGYKIVICLYFIETLINTRQSVIIQLERKVLKSGFKTDPRSLWIWYRSDFTNTWPVKYPQTALLYKHAKFDSNYQWDTWRIRGVFQEANW